MSAGIFADRDAPAKRWRGRETLQVGLQICDRYRERLKFGAGQEYRKGIQIHAVTQNPGMSAFDQGGAAAAEWIEHPLSGTNPEDVEKRFRDLRVELALVLVQAVDGISGCLSGSAGARRALQPALQRLDSTLPIHSFREIGKPPHRPAAVPADQLQSARDLAQIPVA